MEHQPDRRGLAVVIAAAALLVGACSGGGSSGSPTTGSPGSSGSSATSGDPTTLTTATSTLTATLSAQTSGVVVNGVEVPEGETRSVRLNEQIVLGEEAQAHLRVGELQFLLDAATMRLVSWDPTEIGSYLDKGILDVTVDEQASAHLRLATSSDAVITTLQPGTHIWVCQGPGVTCLCVKKGEAEWEQQGQVERYPAPYRCSFAGKDEPPQLAKCPAIEVLDDWYQKVLHNEAAEDLGGLVKAAPLCEPDAAASTTMLGSAGTNTTVKKPGTSKTTTTTTTTVADTTTTTSTTIQDTTTTTSTTVQDTTTTTTSTTVADTTTTTAVALDTVPVP